MSGNNPYGVFEEAKIEASDPRVWLTLWVNKLLTFKNDVGCWHYMCREYFNKSCHVIGLDEQHPEKNDWKNTILPTGNAISPLSAAQCTWQGSRTAKFIQGIHKAILDLRERFPGEKLIILYAGCGPLAPLAFPLLAHFGCEQIAFDCLDIHASSLNRAKKLADYYGIEAGIKKWICGDAATLTNETASCRYHLIISEVMQEALKNEPQVAVMIHLSQFLVEDGIFIPERVSLSLQYYYSEWEKNEQHPDMMDVKRFTSHVADVFELSLEKAKQWSSLRTNCIPAAKVRIPPAPDGKSALNIITDLQIYGEIWMGIYECSLNLPVNVDKMLAGLSEVEFYYEMCEIPGLRIVQ